MGSIDEATAIPEANARERRRYRPLRWVARIVGGLVLLLLLLLVGGFALLQTGLGKRQLASLVSNLASSPTQRIELAGIGGLVPFDMRVDRVALADAHGTWLTIEGIHLGWAPLQLLQGRLLVEDVSARRVAMPRLPAGSAAEPPPEPDQPFRLPQLPQLPASLPALTIERLALPRIELGAPVLGEEAVFGLEGGLGTGPNGRMVQADLDLQRLDEATAQLSFDLALDLGAQTLALDLTAAEQGGLLAGVSGRPEAGDLTLALAGAGPLADWRGELDLDAVNLASVDLALQMRLAGLPAATLAGDARLARGLLPPEFAPIVGERVALAATLEPISPTTLQLTELKLTASGFELQGQGTADLAAEHLQTELALAIPELADLSALAGRPLTGVARLTLTAAGAFTQPALDASLRLTQPGLADITADTVELTAALRPLAPLGGPGLPAATATVSGRIVGVTQAGVAVAGAEPLTLEAAAALDRDGKAQLQRFEIAGPYLVAQGTGQIDVETLDGNAKLTVESPDLAALSRALQPLAPVPPLTGGTRLSVDLTSTEQAARVEAGLRVEATGLAGLPAPTTTLLGPSPAAEAHAVLLGRNRLTLDRLAVQGAELALSGEGSYTLEDGALSGRLDLRLPALAALEPALGQPIAGAAEIVAQVEGSLATPSLKLDATATDLRVAGQNLTSLTLQATASGAVEALAGHVTLAAKEPRAELALDAAYARRGQTLAIDELALRGPGAEVTGDLALDLQPLLATGTLRGEISSLAALEPFLGQRITGAVALSAELTAPDGRQAVKATLRARDLAGTFGSLASAELDASATDLKSSPGIDARLAANGFREGEIVVETATARASGDLGRLAVAVDAAGGQAGQPFSLATTADVAIAPGATSIRVATLQGRYQGQSLALGQPARVTLEGGAIALAGLDLRYGEARLTGDASYGGERLAASLKLAPTPLQAFAAFGAPPLQGRIEASLDASGTPQAPQARVNVAVRQARPTELRGLQVPPADLDLAAAFAGGRIEATARLAGVTERPFTARTTLPLRLRFEPFEFALPQDQPITASLEGQADLARLGQILALDAQRVAGRLDVDVDVAGTIAAPRASGAIAILDGAVEDAITGVLLRDLQVRITGNQNRLVVQRLEARDRGDGRITGSGEMRLDGTTPSSFQVNLVVEAFRALRNDFGTAQVSGDLSFAGDLANARATGTVRVDRADLRIPEVSGGGPPTIVVRVAGEERPAPAQAAAAAPLRIALDIKVEAPARVYVRGRGLESEWDGALQVAGTADAPLVTGQIAARRGFLDLLGQRFTIDRGEIIFDGRQPPLPSILIVTSATGYEIKAIFTIRGPADDLKVEMSSEPIYPQDEIISRLLFNRPAAQITPAQGIRVALAVRQLQSGDPGFLDTARDLLGVDTLDVTGSSAEDAAVSAGKYINDRVYLEVQRGVTPQSGKARVQIEITPNISAQTEVNEQAQTGVQLQWKYDY